MTNDPSGDPASPDELARARELILAYGWNVTAYQILNPGMRLWFSAAGDAVAGFVDSHGVRVVAGAPVTPDPRMGQVARELEAGADREGLRVCYFCAGTRLLGAINAEAEHTAVVIGAQPAWNPSEWPGMLSTHASVRAQLNRARNKGVSVDEWTSARATDDPGLRRCLDEWLATRGLPPLHFLVESRTLERLFDRRVFVASRDGRVVGFLVASPIPARSGWLIEQIIRGETAPNGTSELLIDAVVQALRADGYPYVTLGLAPLSTFAGPLGDGGPPWLRFVLSWMRAHVRRFYNFRGLEAFKAKFRPAVWEPIFAISAGRDFPPRMLYGIAGAFSDRSVASTVGRALAGAARQEMKWLAGRLPTPTRSGS